MEVRLTPSFRAASTAVAQSSSGIDSLPLRFCLQASKRALASSRLTVGILLRGMAFLLAGYPVQIDLTNNHRTFHAGLPNGHFTSGTATLLFTCWRAARPRMSLRKMLFASPRCTLPRPKATSFCARFFCHIAPIRTRRNRRAERGSIRRRGGDERRRDATRLRPQIRARRGRCLD